MRRQNLIMESSTRRPTLSQEPAKRRRKWKNILVEPKSQGRAGIIIFAVGFTGISALFGVILARLNSVLDGLVEMSAHPEIALETASNVKSTLWACYFILLAAFLCSAIYLALTLTHRYLGPMVAIRRQLKAMREGRFEERVHLRTDDEFRDVADDLNAITEQLTRANWPL